MSAKLLLAVPLLALGCSDLGALAMEEDPSGSATAGGNESHRLRGITAAHNDVRAGVDAGMPDLEWSAELATVAQAYAEKLARSSCDLVHSGGSYGENLA